MTEISNSMSAYAKLLAQELDISDIKDGKIKAETWNNIFKAKEKGGKEIKSHISVFNAEKSIKSYLKRIEKNEQAQIVLSKEWMNELKEEIVKDELEKERVIEESTVTSTETRNISADNINLRLLESYYSVYNIAETAVSTYVARNVHETEITNSEKEYTVETLKETLGLPDINKYTEIAKATKLSTVKSGEDYLHADILDKAFDNVIKELMRKGGKKESVLIGTARDFLNAAQAQEVDTFMLMGISMIESAYGTSKMALTKNNACGLTPNGHDGMACDSVASSITIGAQTLHRNAYDKGLDSIQSVGMRGNYCCGTSEQRSSWVRSVTIFANLVRSEYNKLLSEKQAEVNALAMATE